MHMNEYLARERHRDLLASAAEARLARQATAGSRPRLPRPARVSLWYAGWFLPGPAKARRWLMRRLGDEA